MAAATPRGELSFAGASFGAESPYATISGPPGFERVTPAELPGGVPLTPVTGTLPGATTEAELHGMMAETPRNAPCPCGSGKKFKHCHGRLA
ncbi:hypothetical protein AA0498_2539 [Acidomonas methanolica]|nr:hypothetical protein AA0498_2539 [Acidomonas methanolica]